MQRDFLQNENAHNKSIGMNEVVCDSYSRMPWFLIVKRMGRIYKVLNSLDQND